MSVICSVGKIVKAYFASVTWTEFTYRGVTYAPKAIAVSTSLFGRKMTCVEKCGACCPRFTLDYIPVDVEKISDPAFRDSLKLREIEFNGKKIGVWSDTQEDRPNEHYCRFLNQENGRCGIHKFNPFSCDFELLRFSCFPPDKPNILAHRPFGRAWNMLKIDGTRGAICEWSDVEKVTEEQKLDLIRKLLRLKEWTDYFGLETAIPAIIDWVRRGPFDRPVVIYPPSHQKGLF